MGSISKALGGGRPGKPPGAATAADSKEPQAAGAAAAAAAAAREIERPPDYASLVERLRDPDQELYRSLERKIQAQSGPTSADPSADPSGDPGGERPQAPPQARPQAGPQAPPDESPVERLEAGPLELGRTGVGGAGGVDLGGLDRDQDEDGRDEDGRDEDGLGQDGLDEERRILEALAGYHREAAAPKDHVKVVNVELSNAGRAQAEPVKSASSKIDAAGPGSARPGSAEGDGPGRARGGGDGGGPGPGLLRPLLIAVIAASVIAGGWLFISRRRPEPPPAPEVPVVEAAPPDLPAVVAVEPEIPPGPMGLDRAWRQGLIVDSFAIERGGTISEALATLRLSQAQRHALYGLFEREGLLAQVKPGEQFQAWWSDPARPEDSLERLEFRSRPEDRPLVFLPAGDGSFVHFNAAAPPKMIHQATEGSVNDSFWAAGERAGLEPWVILHLVDLMASQVDFVSDIRRGDDFQLLFLGEYQEGRLVAKPVIEMIRMTNDGRKYEFYRHVGDDEQEGYFDAQFRSIHKNFFKSPLQYSRISSGFSRARRHPILKIVRPHLGVDYAAPEGTPVSAVAAGVVVSAGFRGDYGRLVVLDHDGDYRTMYGHLSRIAKGLAPGVKVAQGDLVGNVGMSGLATGPHLDFRMLFKGQFVDPEQVLQVQEGRPLPAEERARFAAAVAQDQALLRQILDGS
jgi:murein DD-endopeptidase MepM/ murein hydrolase activator NlpD